MTVSVTVVVCCVLPLVPVIVIGYVPAGVLAPTLIVIVDLPEPGAGMVCGLKLTVVPVGAPDADRLMAPLKPPLMVEVTVEFPWFPCWIVSEDGEAESVKPGCCCDVTVRVTVVLLFCRPAL